MKTLLKCCALSAITAFGVSTADAQKVSPKVVSAPSPGYPEELTDTGLNGQAEVDITVKTDGTVADAQLAMATHRAFGRAAMGSIKEWKFEPGQRDGIPTDMRVSIPFHFTASLEQQVNAFAKRKVFAVLPEPALSQSDYGAKLKVKRPARPIYPRGAAAGGSDVTVQVNFVVAPDGTTLNPSVAGNAPKDFVSAALQAVAQMTYEPPVKAGKPVYVEATTKLEFAAERRSFGGEGGGFGGGSRGGGGGGSRGGGGRDGGD